MLCARVPCEKQKPSYVRLTIKVILSIFLRGGYLKQMKIICFHKNAIKCGI